MEAVRKARLANQPHVSCQPQRLLALLNAPNITHTSFKISLLSQSIIIIRKMHYNILLLGIMSLGCTIIVIANPAIDMPHIAKRAGATVMLLSMICEGRGDDSTGNGWRR